MTQLTFAVTNPYVVNPPGQFGQVTARPWVEVVVAHQVRTHRVWCLVDTGADDTMLDLGTAVALQVFPGNLPQTPVRVANGQLVNYARLQATLSFAGATVPAAAGIDILIGPVAVPLLGRSALVHVPFGLAAVGFQNAQWLHT